MESEKIMYWLTLGVLAMATITGFAAEHRGWEGRLAQRTISMMSQASEVAANYSGLADTVLGRSENDSASPALAELAVNSDIQNNVQAHLACAQRILVRRQAELVRLQAMRVRVQALDRAPRTIVWPARNIVVEIPQTPEEPEDTF
jgi:hypothetical protein